MLERERVYCHYFLRMGNHPVGWPLLYETPLGMFCLYGKVMESTEGTTGATEIEAGKNGSTHVQCLWPESQANQSLQTKKLFTYV